MQKLTLVLGLSAALFTTACGEEPAAEPDPAVVEAEKEAEMKAKEAEMAAAAAKAEAEKMAAKAMSIGDLMAAKADQMGKSVTIAGTYASMEEKDGATHVTIAASSDEGAASLVCVMAGTVEGMEAGAEMKVTGTLAEADGVAMLNDCAKAEEPAMAEGDAAEGTAAEGEGEGDAAEGDAAMAEEGEAHE